MMATNAEGAKVAKRDYTPTTPAGFARPAGPPASTAAHTQPAGRSGYMYSRVHGRPDGPA